MQNRTLLKTGVKPWVTGVGLAGLLAMGGSAVADDFLAGLPDPTRPSAPGERLVAVEPRGGMLLQAITISPGRRSAMINGKTLTEGERIGGAKLVAINPHEVTLSQNGRDVYLRLMPALVKQRSITEADHRAATP